MRRRRGAAAGPGRWRRGAWLRLGEEEEAEAAPAGGPRPASLLALCCRNSLLEAELVKKGQRLPAPRKTGTTIAGVVFKVRRAPGASLRRFAAGRRPGRAGSLRRPQAEAEPGRAAATPRS